MPFKRRTSMMPGREVAKAAMGMARLAKFGTHNGKVAKPSEFRKQKRLESFIDENLAAILRVALPRASREEVEIMNRRIFISVHAMEIREPELQDKGPIKGPSESTVLDAITNSSPGSLDGLGSDLELISKKSRFGSLRKAATDALERLRSVN